MNAFGRIIACAVVLFGSCFVRASGEVAPDGRTQIQVHLPHKVQFRNAAGTDGSGLCVSASITYAARWQNNDLLSGFFEYCRNYPGGSWPEKVDQQISEIANKAGMNKPNYLQYTGHDDTIIKLALKTRRMPCITWNGNHMLCCAYWDGKQAAILDNNRPGHYTWYDAKTFLRRWRMPGRSGWVVVLLDSPPPRPPINPGQRWPEPVAQKNNTIDIETPLPPGYEWIEDPDSDWYELRRNGKTVGSWNAKNGIFHRYDAKTDTWKVSMPPVETPEAKPVFGVISEQLPAEEGWWLNGKPVGKIEAIMAIASGLRDDSQLPFLTVISQNKQMWKSEIDKLFSEEELADLHDKVHIQVYSPGDWAIADAGFDVSGAPAVYCQKADGTVVARGGGWPGGKWVASAIRRAHPDYKAENDPPFVRSPLGSINDWIITVLLGLGLLFMGAYLIGHYHQQREIAK